jgi:hypothetical protein
VSAFCLETCHFIIICFIREDVVLKLRIFKFDVSITFNKWFFYIMYLYYQLYRSGVIYSLYKTTCSTLNHVVEASTAIHIKKKYIYMKCIFVCVYFNNFTLQISILTLSLHILGDNCTTAIYFTSFQNFIQYYIVTSIVNCWDPTDWTRLYCALSYFKILC